MKKHEVDEGTVALVPVTPTGFAVAVVIRTTGRGSALGAFFGPRVNDASEVDISKLSLDSALLVCKFGDYGLHRKLWPVIGSIANWNRARWSAPKFSRSHDNPDLCYVTEYDDSLEVISEQLLPASEGKHLPDEAQYGSGVVEAKLAKLLQ